MPNDCNGLMRTGHSLPRSLLGCIEVYKLTENKQTKLNEQLNQRTSGQKVSSHFCSPIKTNSARETEKKVNKNKKI